MDFRNAIWLAGNRIDCEINHPEYGWIPCTLAEGDPPTADLWIVASAVAAPYVPIPPSPAEYVELCRAAVQSHVDATARSRLYDNGHALASYVASTNPAWAAEAQAFVAWRDAVWVQVYGLWASPPDPWPTPEQIVADLPLIEWPE